MNRKGRKDHKTNFIFLCVLRVLRGSIPLPDILDAPIQRAPVNLLWFKELRYMLISVWLRRGRYVLA